MLYLYYDIVRKCTMSHVKRTMSYVCFEVTSQGLQIFPIPPPKAWAYGQSLSYKFNPFLGPETSATGWETRQFYT